MPESQNPLEHITDLINTKCSVKQQTYRNLQEVFVLLKSVASELIRNIQDHARSTDKDVTLDLYHESDNEFHVKIAGDMLVFLLHSNIVVQPESHGFNATEYVKENPMRKYLGQINVYNFMADSFKYNRVKDPGYLIARLFVNYENHFLVEGDGQLNFMFEKVSAAPITPTDANIFLQLAIAQAMDNDLITPPFPSIRQITLDQKMERSANMGMGSKIGFQMNYRKNEENEM